MMTRKGILNCKLHDPIFGLAVPGHIGGKELEKMLHFILNSAYGYKAALLALERMMNNEFDDHKVFGPV